jgi:hypothetical protein
MKPIQTVGIISWYHGCSTLRCESPPIRWFYIYGKISKGILFGRCAKHSQNYETNYYGFTTDSLPTDAQEVFSPEVFLVMES